MVQQPSVGQGPFIIEASRSHSDTHTRTHALDRTSLEVWSALRRDLRLTTHNTHNRQTSMPPGEFDPVTPANERPFKK